MEPSFKSFEMLGQLMNLPARESAADFGSITQSIESNRKKDSSENGFGSLLAREKARSAESRPAREDASSRPEREAPRARTEGASRAAEKPRAADNSGSQRQAVDQSAEGGDGKDLPPEGERSPVSAQKTGEASGTTDTAEAPVDDSQAGSQPPAQGSEGTPVAAPAIDTELVVDGELPAAVTLAGDAQTDGGDHPDAPDGVAAIGDGDSDGDTGTGSGERDQSADGEAVTLTTMDGEPGVDATGVDPTATAFGSPGQAATSSQDRPVDGGRGAERSAAALAAATERNPEAAQAGLERAAAAGVRASGAETPVQGPVEDPGRRAAPAEIAPRGPQVGPVAAGAEADAGADADAGDHPARRDRTLATGEAIRLAARSGDSAGREVNIEVRAARTGAQPVSESQGVSTAPTTRAQPGLAAQQAARPGAASAETLAQGRVQVGRDGWDQVVAQRIAAMASRGVQGAEIRLDPPELGPIKVAIQVNSDQQASVTINSHNAGVREALEMTANRLREMFAEGGLNLANLDVADHGFGDGAQEEAGEATGHSASGEGDVSMAGDDDGVDGRPLVSSQSLVDFYV